MPLIFETDPEKTLDYLYEDPTSGEIKSDNFKCKTNFYKVVKISDAKPSFSRTYKT